MSCDLTSSPPPPLPFSLFSLSIFNVDHQWSDLTTAFSLSTKAQTKTLLFPLQAFEAKNLIQRPQTAESAESAAKRLGRRGLGGQRNRPDSSPKQRHYGPAKRRRNWVRKRTGRWRYGFSKSGRGWVWK